MEREAIYGVVFNKEKTKVLLVERRDLPVWVLPGGGLDLGEHPFEGTKREVEEEIGTSVRVIRQVAKYLPVNKLTQTTHFFECLLEGDNLKPTEESRTVQFFPINALPSRLAPPFALWIADALKGEDTIIEKKTEGVTYTLLCKLLLTHPLITLRYLLTKIGIRFNCQD